MESHIGGSACHSSINRGVSPSNNVFGLISISPELCFNTAESPKSRTLFASCFAVVVLPHHLGPSINTAPLPRTLRSRILSAIRCLYFAITFYFECKSTNFYLIYLIILYIFGRLWEIYSVVCGKFIRLFDVNLFGCLWKILSNARIGLRYFVDYTLLIARVRARTKYQFFAI